MDYIYTAMLLHSAKQPITEENVKKVLSATGGAQADELKVKQLVTALEGVNIDEAVKQAAVVAAAAPAAGGEAKKEEKKDEKSEAAKEEEAAAGLAALFG